LTANCRDLVGVPDNVQNQIPNISLCWKSPFILTYDFGLYIALPKFKRVLGHLVTSYFRG